MTFFRMEATALDGFDVFFGVLFGGGHGALLRTVVLSMMGVKKTVLPEVGMAKEGPPCTLVDCYTYLPLHV
jgi:hypothetical protein